MNFKDRKEAFYSRFGVEIEPSDPLDLEKQFRSSILNYIDDVDFALKIDEVRYFCGLFGARATFGEGPHGEYGKNVKKLFVEEKNFTQFLLKLEALISFTCCKSPAILTRSFSNNIETVFKNTELPIRINISRKECVIYPEGCAFLDGELIIKTIKFLNDKSHDHFIKALKEYMNHNYIKSAEHSRRSLEEYLRFKLQNTKGLQQNIQELCKSKKDQSLSEIRNTFTNVADCLDKLFNSHSKHNDGKINENECEYIIYQVAVIMRYIYKLI